MTQRAFVLLGAFLVMEMSGLVSDICLSKAEAQTSTAKPQASIPNNTPYVVLMRVSRNGYFLENGTRALETLEVPRGPVELVLRYDDKFNPSNMEDALRHQFAISNNVTGFYLQSPLLSPEQPTAKIRFNAGENGTREYDIFCSISCDPSAMSSLFRKIKVIEKSPS